MELVPIIFVLCVFSPVALGHGDHGGGKPLEFASEIHNKDHILEHLQQQIATKPKDQLSDEELEFHYFKLHDYDNNNKLDGVEIGKALTHFHDDESSPELNVEESDIAEEVDEVIRERDKNSDGYLEYYEWRSVDFISKQN